MATCFRCGGKIVNKICDKCGFDIESGDISSLQPIQQLDLEAFGLLIRVYHEKGQLPLRYKRKEVSEIVKEVHILDSSKTSAKNYMGWGPAREVFTMRSRAEQATFNSIVDNPEIGDERSFVRIGEIGKDVTFVGKSVKVSPGRQYLVYIYFHNDADETFNQPEYGNRGVAFKTLLSTSFSKTITAEEGGRITATITAQNTIPAEIHDVVFLSTDYKHISLRYVDGSAKIFHEWKTNGSTLASTLFSDTGTPIGLNALNGVVLGGTKYKGIVAYVLEARALSGTIELTVSNDGSNYTNRTAVKNSDILYFKLTIANAGDIPLENATIRNLLPNNCMLIPGSVKFWANESTIMDKLNDSIAYTGINLGRIGLGNTAYITYQGTIANNSEYSGIYTKTHCVDFTYYAGEHETFSDTSVVSIKIDNRRGYHAPVDIADGHGTYCFDNGDKYSGCWVSGQPHGFGTMTFSNGDVYAGNWENGNITGNGKYVWANGNVYEGEWLEGRRHGRGKMAFGKSSSYDGEWKNDKKDGRGTEVDGKYARTGLFVSGLKEGTFAEYQRAYPAGVYTVRYEKDVRVAHKKD